MVRIAATSDLHFDPSHLLTPPERITHVVEAMRRSKADALVVAGDIGHPLANFTACLDLFRSSQVPVGIVAGNHDVWRDEQFSSQRLWEHALPTATTQRGFVWLERRPIIVGRVGIVGTMAWYDYSAAEPSLVVPDNYYAAIKPRISNDAHWIDWTWSDPEFAAILRERLVVQLDRLERNPRIDRIVVVTHVPLFEEQIVRNADNFVWSLATAYFGNLDTGRVVSAFPKVRVVVSGHLHTSRTTVVPRRRSPDIQALVIGSDYGDPAWVQVDL